MTFLWPVMLFGLVLLPLLVGGYIQMQQRRRQLAAIYGSPGTGGAVLVPSAGRAAITWRGVRRHVPAALFLIALAILIVALARPQTVVSLPRVEGTVVLVFDVSGSMAADDLKPTRME